MPELPEVETVRRDLAGALVGRRVVAVELTGARTVRRQGPVVVAGAARGRTVQGLDRRGKYLLVLLDDGALVVHLRMSGQLRLVEPSQPRAPHTHAVLGLDDGRELRFVDPRTFGEIYATTPDAPELDVLGVDAWDPGVGPAQLRRLLAGRRAPVKAVLLDQRRLAGLGNIYTDEILHQARVHPSRPAGEVSPAAVARVVEATADVLGRAIEARGSSLYDQQYVDLWGRTGRFQFEHQVYGRAGEPCPRCGRPVERIRFGARSSYSCRRCQR